MMAGVTGIEPATSCVTGKRSNQTELHPRWNIARTSVRTDKKQESTNESTKVYQTTLRTG